MALEEQFGCMFEAEDIPELVSLERIEEIVKRHGARGD
jgi:acyl carrier protein